jgi:ribosomal protein L19|tara:strand:- start:67 stop:225 length:159 start_codon:yes stop_codon:yes gene_type:complete
MPLTGGQKKLDVTRDGKITREDLMILRNRRGKKAITRTRAKLPRRRGMREYD